ncbi:hypothetical protein QL093DRAFT_2089587 [Fusarium oxysporum]|nr:hypothetical protein QL093DRAFT_2089587 [Fusarium oxysporum]
MKDGTAQILEEINQLQAQLSNQDDYILQNFLEDMTTYTENALDGASIDWKSSSTQAPSPNIKDEEDVFADESDVKSSTTRFTALTFPGREFAFQDILRPSRFQPPRRIKIAFYIPVDAFIRPALAQQVVSPWQNIIVIIEGPPRWIKVNPNILMLFRELGILFETNQSIDYVGRVSVYPPYHIERDKIFERPILGTIYEVIAVAPHQHRNDPTHYNLQYYDNWAVAVCNVLKPEFIVTLPQVSNGSYWGEAA